MRGYLVTTGEEPPVTPAEVARWEALATDAVGNVIEFWGFKRNHGRIWALLYLRGVAMTATEIQESLALSKGAVSMISRELEQWGVVQRVRPTASSAWRFVAETDLMTMIGRVIKQRETDVISRVKQDLTAAARHARETPGISPEALERVERMRKLAGLMEGALEIFLKTARLNVASAVLAFQKPKN